MNSFEIAKMANVSRSTVSRVVNNYSNVPPETKERVQKIIDKYGYTPNASARTLAGKANDIIGLFLADIDHSDASEKWIGVNSPYNAELIARVIQSCKRRGYMVLVNSITHESECAQMEKLFQNRMIYGGIFVGFPYRMQELEAIAGKENNVVLIDQLTEADDRNHAIKLLNCDDELGGYLATKHLLESGHRDIVFMSGDYRLSSMEREKGYKRALSEAKIPIDNDAILHGEYREEVAYERMKEYLINKKPDAVFSGNDIMALGIIQAIRESGLRVPEDISIIGFDNLQFSTWKDSNLTSMNVDMEELAEKAVALLFSKEKGKHDVCLPILHEKMTVQKRI